MENTKHVFAKPSTILLPLLLLLLAVTMIGTPVFAKPQNNSHNQQSNNSNNSSNGCSASVSSSSNTQSSTIVTTPLTTLSSNTAGVFNLLTGTNLATFTGSLTGTAPEHITIVANQLTGKVTAIVMGNLTGALNNTPLSNAPFIAFFQPYTMGATNIVGHLLAMNPTTGQLWTAIVHFNPLTGQGTIGSLAPVTNLACVLAGFVGSLFSNMGTLGSILGNVGGLGGLSNLGGLSMLQTLLTGLLSGSNNLSTSQLTSLLGTLLGGLTGTIGSTTGSTTGISSILQMLLASLVSTNSLQGSVCSAISNGLSGLSLTTFTSSPLTNQVTNTLGNLNLVSGTSNLNFLGGLLQGTAPLSITMLTNPLTGVTSGFGFTQLTGMLNNVQTSNIPVLFLLQSLPSNPQMLIGQVLALNPTTGQLIPGMVLLNSVIGQGSVLFNTLAGLTQSACQQSSNGKSHHGKGHSHHDDDTDDPDSD